MAKPVLYGTVSVACIFGAALVVLANDVRKWWKETAR